MPGTSIAIVCRVIKELVYLLQRCKAEKEPFHTAVEEVHGYLLVVSHLLAAYHLPLSKHRVLDAVTRAEFNSLFRCGYRLSTCL
jgi:hypothetical protein